MKFDENIERVERKGWVVDHKVSYRGQRSDQVYGYDKDHNYGVGIGFDPQSGEINSGIIMKDPRGEDRATRNWTQKSIPTPAEVADAFERPGEEG